MNSDIEFGSVCSGIEAASVAWDELGFKPAWFSEIEPFPCKLLHHHYPTIPNHGDILTLPERIRTGVVTATSMLCGGTPCQAFSIAGKRESMDDQRGNLTLTFCEIANAIDDIRHTRDECPAIIFWENVPGVLSTEDNAFGCFLGALAGEDCELVPPGEGWKNAGVVYGPRRAIAWRVLDAQYFGVAQRRRRVFVVASARNGFDPAAVLFEFDGVRRDTAPSREKREVAPTIPARSTAGGGLGTDFDIDGGVITCLAHGQGGAEIAVNRSPTLTCNHEAPIIASTLDASYGRLQGCSGQDANHGHSHLVPVAFVQNHRDEVRLMGGDGSIVGALPAESGVKQQCYIAFPERLSGTQCASSENIAPSMCAANPTAVAFGGDIARSLTARHDSSPCADRGMDIVAVRQLSPTITSNYGKQVDNSDTALGPNVIAYTTKLHNTNSNNAGKIFEERTVALDANSPPPALLTAMQVRRLTPTECERLQGFPDGYTQVPNRGKPAADGPRYKSLGNSWAVPNVRWIGQRIKTMLEFIP